MTPPPAELRECGPNAGLFAHLQHDAADRPELALACSALLPNEAQRDRILRGAFLSAVSQKPEVAGRYLAQVFQKPWLTDAGFFPLCRLALSISREAPQQAHDLLLKAALRYPSLALREYDQFLPLPFGVSIFEQAAVLAPDEAVGLAAGDSTTAEVVKAALQRSRSPELAILLSLACDTQLSRETRRRAAVFVHEIASGRLSLPHAIDIAQSPAFFSAVASLRVGATQAAAPLYDRVLENYAEVLFRFAQDAGAQSFANELRQLPARDLYLLLTYGRTEEDDLLFATVFDRLLQPKLKNSPPSRILDQVHGLNLRRFLATAVAHHRLDAFLAADRKPAQTDVLARSIRNLDAAERPVDEAVACAEIIDAIQDATQLAKLKDVIVEEHARASLQAKTLYGLLAAAASQKLTSSDAAFDALSARYRGYFKAPRVLDAAALFAHRGVCVQQHFFYDDDDAAESFNSFQQIYRRDRAWVWEDHGWYVRVTAAGAAGRGIQIYANVPHSAASPGVGNRRHALAKLLAEKALTPTVVVHRGHTWYVEESLRYLTPEARLVFLGSCRGLANAYSVIAVANNAQFIATRGVGTQEINDPLLKALNDELLRGEKNLEWDRFWRSLDLRLGHNPVFRDYISPPRNPSAIMLAAYYDLIAEGKTP